MTSSDSDSHSAWNKELITAVRKKPTKAKMISEEDRRRQIQDCLDAEADINTVDENGNTALHTAVKKGYQIIVEFLLQNGASIDIPNRKGHTALKLAEILGESNIENILKKTTNPIVRRSPGASGLISVPDNRKPSTSRASHSSSKDSSYDKHNTSGRTTQGLKRKTSADDDLDINPRKPRLALSNVARRRSRPDYTVHPGSRATTAVRNAGLSGNYGRFTKIPHLNEERPYATSGLKRSLHGNIYQLKHLMLILHRAWNMGYAFRLSTEVDAAEKFDDLVLHYRDKAGNEVHRFLQVKHKQDETKTIGARQLVDVKDGDFSLLKYFISWRKIKRHSEFGGSRTKNFILCTNIGLDVEGLRKEKINVSEVREPDVFLKVSDRTEQPPRYKLQVEKSSELYDTLKKASHVHILAREIAERICGSKDIYLNTEIIKCYHAALTQEIVDMKSQKFSLNFIRNKNLSSRAKKFREIFIWHTKKLWRCNVSENDIWKDLTENKLKLSATFGKKFEFSTQPQVTHMGRFSDEFVKLLNNASTDNVVEICRRRYNKRASELSIERIVADNIDKLAGHVFITENGKIKFRSLFLNDTMNLLGNLNEFKHALKSRLGSKFDELYKFEFGINNFKTCTEEELSLRTELPDDDIDDQEISSFLNEFILAVKQPNEIELGEMIKHEIGADSQFNLLDAGLIRDSFQNAILDWFKEKQGKFLESKDAEDFFNEIEVKLGSLITMTLSLEYSEKLHEHGIEFICEHTELQNFINSSNYGSYQILELITSGKTLLTALRVHQTLAQQQEHEENKSFILIRLETLLRQGIMKKVLRAFEWPHNHNMLVVDCESSNAKKHLQKLWKPLCRIMAKNVYKRMIVITKKIVDLGTQFGLSHQTYNVKDDDHCFGNLTNNSQKKVLGKPVTKFQGHDIKTSFGELLGILDFDNLRADELKDLSEIINSDTLLELVCSDEIQVGCELKGLDEIENYYYINRTIFQHVIIKKDILTPQEIPDLLVISDMDKEFSDKLMQLGESSFTTGTPITDLVAVSSIVTDFRGELMQFDEISPMAQRPLKYIILDSTKEEEQFKALCVKYEHRNIHWLKKKSGKYIWKKSQGDITYLVQYRDVKESDDHNDRTGATDFNDNQLAAQDEPVIISDIAGMGKSIMLTRLTYKIKQNSPDMLVLKIDLNHHATALAKVGKKSSYDLGNMNGAVQFLVKELLSDETNLARKVFNRIIVKQLKVALIFDGFDEISPTYEGTVIDLLQTLKNSGIKKLFIATRPHTRGALEKKLNAFSYEIQPLSTDNQEDFLTRFWITKVRSNSDSKQRTMDRIKKYAKAIIEKLAISIKDQTNKFTGIPLQTRLVAEIFESHSEGNPENVDSCEEFRDSEVEHPRFSEKINLISLYERFVEKKFDNYFENKCSKNASEAIKDLRTVYYREFIKTHENLALYALFDKEKVEKLLLSRRDGSYRLLQQSNRDIVVERTGIITQFINGKPYFGHRTYAEYFSAKFFFDMLGDRDQNQLLHEMFITDVLLAENYETMRAFMNWLLSPSQIIVRGDGSWKIHLNKHRTEFNETIFHVAAVEGNRRIIGLFLNCLGTNPKDRENFVNVKDNYGRTAVHRAAEYGHLEGIKLLVEHNNYEINSQDKMGGMPLHLAAYNGKLDCIKYLLDKGANINARENNGLTPLHLAAQQGKVEVVKYLFDKGANINSQENNGPTPLHIAACLGKLDVVKYLLDNGAHFNSQTIDCMTPLHQAAGRGKLDVVKYLLDNGASVKSQAINGMTSLHQASGRGELDVVKYLHDKGSDVNCQGSNGVAPLHLAAFNGQLEVGKYLLDSGANINCQQSDGSTSLHLAAGKGELDFVKYLLYKGANINTQGNNGSTPLHIAAQEGKLDIVKFLLDNGADFMAQSDNGVTPFHLAAGEGKLDVIEYFLNTGLNVDYQENNGPTPLHVAAYKATLDAVKYLLNKEANINARENDGSTPLHLAAQQDKLDIAKYLLDKGADISSQLNDGSTPLHLVARIGKLDFVEYFLDKGANIDAQKNNGSTPLHLAIQEGEVNVVKYLLDKGANVNSQENDGQTPLHVAACIEILDTIKYLLDKGADVNSQAINCITPLHQAAATGQLNVVKYLLDNGANVNCQGSGGMTPLHLAAQQGKSEVGKYLLDKGADVSPQQLNGLTPLHLAAGRGELDFVKYLLYKGANINTRETNGLTPLHVAVREGKVNVVKYLLDKGANINSQEKNGPTPLHIAACTGKLDIVKYLLDKGADFNSQAIDCMTPLHQAAGKGELDVVKYLLDNGASVKAQAINGMTPLHQAAGRGQLDVVKYLHDKGSNVNYQGSNGVAPLHLAAFNGQLEVGKYLLDNGADINSQQSDGSTSLHLAAGTGELDFAKYLLYKGANINARGNNGSTPLHIAAQQGNLDVAKFLLDKGADFISQSDNGMTPFHLAAGKGKLDIVKYFVDKGVNINYQENNGPMPLHIAARTGKLGIVKYLLDKEANINCQGNRSVTPLHLAAYNGKLEVGKYLLNKGADISSQQIDGATPLHLAACEGELDFVKYLLDQGANINAQENNGLTPLHLAAREGKVDVVKYLLDKGADANSQGNNGVTPFQLATDKGELDIVQYLLDMGANIIS